MKVNDNNILDKRIVKRHITNGIVKADAYAKHLDGLEDLTGKAEVITAEMVDMGVQDVEAKDTGETE